MPGYVVKPPSELLSAGALRSDMEQVNAKVLLHREIAADHYRIRLKAPRIARRSKPGQFIHILCAGPGETNPLLRRPFSLLDADPLAGTIDFIYKVVGLGTAALTRMPAGADADVIGPLGQPFECPAALREAYLIGGGVGIPPMVLLAKHLLKRLPAKKIHVFIGARFKKWVICAADFRSMGVQLHIATDDGSLGEKGLVVDLAARRLSGGGRPGMIYICGPPPMMAAAARLARREEIPAQVSLEERMGCAMGVCMGCVVEGTTKTMTSHARFQRVCTEGPVFPAEAVAWST